MEYASTEVCVFPKEPAPLFGPVQYSQNQHLNPQRPSPEPRRRHLIWSSSAFARYSAVTPKRPEATCDGG